MTPPEYRKHRLHKRVDSAPSVLAATLLAVYTFSVTPSLGATPDAPRSLTRLKGEENWSKDIFVFHERNGGWGGEPDDEDHESWIPQSDFRVVVYSARGEAINLVIELAIEETTIRRRIQCAFRVDSGDCELTHVVWPSKIVVNRKGRIAKADDPNLVGKLIRVSVVEVLLK